MPWCEDCAQFHDSSALGKGGECPGCGTVIAPARTRVPWHFKLLIVATAVYLVYRLAQGILWMVHHL